MNRTDRILLCCYVLILVLAGLIYLFFEFVSPESMGCLFDPDDRSLRTILETACNIFSIVCIYGSLRLMVLKKVALECQTDEGYLKWALVRWGMISGSMMLCLLTYELFMSTNVVAWLGICAISLLFVWPTKGRRQREMHQLSEEEDL